VTGPYADLLRHGFDEYRRFINPLVSQRANLVGEPVRVVRAEGGSLRGPQDEVVEDFHGTQFFGHRHPAITAAAQEYLASDAPSWYPSRVNPFAGRFARRLCERTGHYDVCFFGMSGADAVEAALKLARGVTGRPRLLGLTGAYHGCTLGALALMAEGYLRDAFGPHLPGVEAVPFGDVEALERALAPGDVAAVVVEPIQGEGGVRELPAPFVAALCELTERHGTLLVADEVQTGLGRTGRGFLASAAWPRRPDAVILAKQLGGGLVPTSAMLSRRELFLKAYGSDFARGESHNVTLGCNALAAVTGLATLELLTDELMAAVAEKGARFKARLTEAVEGCPLVREVRGAGLMLGIALRDSEHPWLSFEHMGFKELGGKSLMSPLLCHRLYRRGFFCFTCGHDWTIFRLQPRYDCPDATLDAFADACREELDYLCQLATD